MFTIDFTKPFLYKDVIYFNQGNLAANNILRCKLITGGDPTLEGYVATVTFKTLSYSEINESVNIVDVKDCIVDIKFPSNALEVGLNELEIILTKGEGVDKVVTPSPIIKYEVWQCITTGNGIQGDNNYPILIDLISDVNNAIRVANNASATADASLKQAARMIEKVDSTLIKANNTIDETNSVKDEALKAADEAKKAITAGTQDLEVKNARGKYESLNDRLNAFDKDLLKPEEIGIIPVVTESNFATIEETTNGYIEDIKLEGKTLIVNSQNEEVTPGMKGATLKSVGDGVEEIVVASMNKITKRVGKFINTVNFTISDDPTSVSFYIENIVAGQEYKIEFSNNDRFVLATYNSLESGSRSIENANVRVNSFIPKENAKYMVVYLSSTQSDSVHCKIYSKSDQKKVLYFDTETQTWKKPALREWDSIEKHSDDKYYYYKRSNENVLNGSENFQLYSQSLDDYLCFFIDIPNCLPKSDLICDKFKNVPAIYLESFVQEGICVHPTLNRFYIKILKSKLSSTDIDGFKKWLQSNPLKVIYKLAVEETYECTPIDLMSFENETNYMIECGAISPKTTLKCVNYIGNVINTLKEKVSYLEDKLYNTNLANFAVALNTLDTKLKLEQLTKTPR